MAFSFCVTALPLFTMGHKCLASFIYTFKLNGGIVPGFFNLPVTLLQEGSQWRYGTHGQRHYFKCGTSSVLQRVVSLPKPRSYNTCNAPVLNYLSFVFCSYITLWIHFKFMMFAAKSTFPVYTYRSIVFSPMYIYTFNYSY